MSTAPPRPFCPYVGLRPYTESDRPYFFGRERDQRIITSNLYAAPLTVFYGASGVGKSSVLLAGVVPALRGASRTAVVVFREWQDPSFLAALKSACVDAVQAALRRALAVETAAPLDDVLFAAATALGGTMVLLLDQFEEYFLYHPVSRAHPFEAELARAVNRQEVEANFLLSLREDAVARLDRFRARIPNLLGNTLRLEHLDAAAAEAAIRGPLDVYRRLVSAEAPVTVDDDLVGEILTQLRTGDIPLSQSGGGGQPPGRDDGARIETPILQLVLTRLWEKESAAGSRHLRLATLKALGGARDIAETHLAGVLRALPAEEQEVCSRFFDRLVTPSGSKIAYPVDDLAKVAGPLAAHVPAVLKTLTEGRILRMLPALPEQPDVSRVEILHDVLARPVLDWRARYVHAQDVAAAATRAAQEAAEGAKDAARELEVAQTRALAEEQRRRAEAEQARAEEEQRRAAEQASAARRLRRLMAAVLIVGFAAAGAAVLAWTQRTQAIQARARADQQRALAEAREREAQAAKTLAEQRAEKIFKNTQLKKAIWSSNRERLRAALADTRVDNRLAFRVRRTPVTHDNPAGQSIYRFEIFPEPSSLPRGPDSIALITYILDHPSFFNSLLPASAERNFTASYTGWGCLRNVIAVVEYTNPDSATTIQHFDMCAAAGL
jgi:hypothetical protein